MSYKEYLLQEEHRLLKRLQNTHGKEKKEMIISEIKRIRYFRKKPLNLSSYGNIDYIEPFGRM